MYVLKTSEIFPYDIESTQLWPDPNRVLRPEFVNSYERPLKSDTKKPVYSTKQSATTERPAANSLTKSTRAMGDDTDEEQHNDIGELNEAALSLRKNVILQLVEIIDSLVVIPVESESFEQIFHAQGVNMRYLGQIH